jgi:hypothetical protein
MSALPLDQVTDYSTIVVGSFGAVSFDLTGQKITGARAVLEHVLRAWLGPTVWTDLGFDVTSLENGDFTPNDVASIRKALTDAALAVDYVLTASVSVTLANRILTATGAITLINGRTYALEVPISGASAAILAQLARAA